MPNFLLRLSFGIFSENRTNIDSIYDLILTRFGCEVCSRLIRSRGASTITFRRVQRFVHWATTGATATELRVKNLFFYALPGVLSLRFREDLTAGYGFEDQCGAE